MAELTLTGAAVSTRATRAAVPLADYLADTAPVAWAIPTVAVAGSVTAVVAPPESFKTFVVVQAGNASAGSGDLLGLHPDPLPFVYVSNEKSPATVRERFRC
ncbi:MAG TPA: AAA family ATPase, partial [Tepidiformaceae bacterium]